MSNKTRSSQIKVPALTFTWEGRTVRAPVKAKDGQPAGTKTILDNQCGCVRPGMRLASLPVCVLPLLFTAVRQARSWPSWVRVALGALTVWA